MKKVLAFLVAVLMMTTSTAFAQLSFMNEFMGNYTQESTFKLSFKSASEIVLLLKEIDDRGSEEVDLRFNLEKFLSTLFSGEGTIMVQSDISKDIKKGEVSIINQNAQTVEVNDNLNVSYSAKAGVWVSYDFTDESAPKVRMIQSSPLYNKYVVFDIDDLLSEKEKFIVSGIAKKFLNAEFIGRMNSQITECVEKNSAVKSEGSSVTVTIDNKGFLNILKEIVELLIDEVLPEIPDFDKDDVEEFFNLLSGSNIKLLGNKGIVTKYTLSNGKISKISTNIDFCINIPEIYKAITQEEWEYISDGKLEFEAVLETDVSSVGTTKVQFPAIDEKNAVSANEIEEILYGGYEVYEEDEYEQKYPLSYVNGDSDKILVIDGKYYFPLRKTIEKAYQDSVEISFENGKINLRSEYFPGFKTLTLADGSSKVYTESGEYEAGVVLIDETGTTYVSNDFFEKILKWELSYLSHDLLDNSYYYAFYTTIDE